MKSYDNYASGLGSINCEDAPPTPSQPIINTADMLDKMLSEQSSILYAIERTLFGPEPSLGGAAQKDRERGALERFADITQRVSSGIDRLNRISSAVGVRESAIGYKNSID